MPVGINLHVKGEDIVSVSNLKRVHYKLFFSFLNNRSYIEAAPKADSIVPEKQNEAGGVGMKFAIYSRKSKATDKGWIT